VSSPIASQWLYTGRHAWAYCHRLVEHDLLEPEDFDDYLQKEMDWDGTCPACISSEDGRGSELITCIACKLLGCERDDCDGHELMA
jgi:hypothetical protein